VQATGVLSAITSLKKLCNHPKLIYDTLHSKAQVRSAITLCSARMLFLSMAAVASCFPSMRHHSNSQSHGVQYSSVSDHCCAPSAVTYIAPAGVAAVQVDGTVAESFEGVGQLFPSGLFASD
jgi:hypothetical protein